MGVFMNWWYPPKKIAGTPNWMVYNGHSNMEDLGGTPFSVNLQIRSACSKSPSETKISVGRDVQGVNSGVPCNESSDLQTDQEKREKRPCLHISFFYQLNRFTAEFVW